MYTAQDVESIADAIEIGGLADATKTLADAGAADRNSLSMLGAAASLASAFSPENASPTLNALAAAATIASLASDIESGEGVSISDVAALAAEVANWLSRSGVPQARAAGVILSGVALLLPYAEDLGHWIGQNLPLPNEISDWFNRAFNFTPPSRRIDPLVLDLDGDGIETLPADGAVLFDHDGDGAKNATGWIKSDDGLLAWDRDGNGTIDNGGELFGDNTLLVNGQKARNGFEALAELDANADGKVDAQDAHFADLRMWRDLNSDGLSQADELTTLAEQNVVAINTGHTLTNLNAGDGNVIIATGSFVSSNGDVHEANSAVNVDFAANNFYREFPDTLPIPQELRALPNMQGSGAVRDLLEAASTSPQLASLLQQFSAATTRAGQMAVLDQLLGAWADSADFQDFTERLNNAVVTKDVLKQDGSIEVVTAANLDFAITIPAPDGGGGMVNAGDGSGGSGSVDDDVRLLNGTKIDTSQLADGDTLRVGAYVDRPELQALAKLRVLEVFNADKFFDIKLHIPLADTHTNSDTYRFSSGSLNRSYSVSNGDAGALYSGKPTLYITEKELGLVNGQLARITAAYESLRDSVYQALAVQTRMASYLGKISIEITETGSAQFGFESVKAHIEQKWAADPVNTAIDVAELLAFNGPTMRQLGWSDGAQWVSEKLFTLSSIQVSEVLGAGISLTVLPSANVTGTSGVDIVMDGDISHLLRGGEGSDVIDGRGGDDTLLGEGGDDLLLGGEGSDSVEGGPGNDTLVGGVGGDALFGDTLAGGEGEDVYNYQQLGWGADYVENHDSGGVDFVQFGGSINREDIRFLREDYHLIIESVDAESTICILNYFDNVYDDVASWNEVVVRFHDGSMLGAGEIKQILIEGSSLGDTIYGYASDDDLFAGLGDDYLDGKKGNDELGGGDGEDTISGWSGDDILWGGGGNDECYGFMEDDLVDGGAGDDLLVGGSGLNGYIFGRGYGHDEIQNDHGGLYTYDVVWFSADIVPEDVRVASLAGGDIVISFSGSQDSLVIKGANYDPDMRVDSYRFAGGEIWGHQQVIERNQMSDYYSWVDGFYQRTDVSAGRLLEGDDGGNVLVGGMGNDTLRGGGGDDYVAGGAGSDEYVFGHGSGVDLVYDESFGGGGVDVLRFSGDVVPGNVWGLQEHDDLVLGLKDSGDRVTLKYYFNELDGGNHVIEQILFDDGVLWGASQIQQLLAGVEPVVLQAVPTGFSDWLRCGDASDDVRAGDGDDVVYGNGGSDALYGENGNDLIYGGAGADMLSGGGDVDTLIGGEANDTLVGGAGADRMEGGSGDDFYYFDDEVAEWLGDYERDVIIEHEGGGHDTVIATVDVLNLAEHVEDLILTGGAIYAYANHQGNHIVANSSGDCDIGGGGGDDVIEGQGGDDLLAGDWGSDVLFGGEGSDELHGGDGQDTLVGGGGEDAMYGGEGDDWYVVDSTSEVVTELEDEGYDLVVTETNYAIPDHVEWMILSGDAVWGMGSDRTEVITANSSMSSAIYGMGGSDLLIGQNVSDSLYGGAGEDALHGNGDTDLLYGGAGADYLEGGAGADTYVLERGSGADTIQDAVWEDWGDGWYVQAEDGAYDRLLLGDGVSADQLWFRQVNEDLEVSIVGTEDSATVSGWFSGESNQLAAVELSSGSRLLQADVGLLVSAMAAFSPPQAGQTSLPEDYQQQLAPVLAQVWRT